MWVKGRGQGTGRKSVHLYQPGNSMMHHLHPFVKLFLVISFSISVIFIQSTLLLFIVDCFIIIFMKRTGVSFISTLKLFRWIFMLIASIVFIDIFLGFWIPHSGEVMFHIWSPYLPIHRQSLYYAARSALWVICFSSWATMLLRTTSPGDFVTGLVEAGFPYKAAITVLIALRYIPLVQVEMESISMAQELRGSLASKGRGVRHLYRVLKDRVSTFLVIIFRQGLHMAISLEKRGFGLKKTRSSVRSIGFKPRDTHVLMVSLVCLAFLVLYSSGFLPIPMLPPVSSIFLPTG
ncbi:hypothetical protein GF325_10195 [Candidatus Bathyarchaeota archaeon]|nr:hypothetical protein [Candidatus Bathyarchaeota archaeon]